MRPKALQHKCPCTKVVNAKIFKAKLSAPKHPIPIPIKDRDVPKIVDYEWLEGPALPNWVSYSCGVDFNDTWTLVIGMGTINDIFRFWYWCYYPHRSRVSRMWDFSSRHHT